MKKILIIVTIIISFFGYSQLTNIADGESLTLRIHYGFLNAGSANLTTKKITFNGVPHLYVKGTGQTTGAVRAFLKWMTCTKATLISLPNYPVFM